MVDNKQLSSPFATGGGGHHFESHVQASFVVLMLSQGYAPWLSCWPIVKIKLQGKVAGYNTDDLIVFVEDPHLKSERKLLAQIKHKIEITNGSKQFNEVMQAAWNDYSNDTFQSGQDKIALITGPISSTDFHGIDWLLGQARHSENADEFFQNVQQAKFSSKTKKDKLKVLQAHLKKCNNGQNVSNEKLYGFLKNFHMLGYDLGTEGGVILSLLHSHISLFNSERPAWLWSRIVDIVQTWNQDAGTITRENLPDDILDAFKERRVVSMPEYLAQTQLVTAEWAKHKNAHYFALMSLVGAWNEGSQCDKDLIARLLCIEYDKCLEIAREFLIIQDSHISIKNGIWRVNNRPELLTALASKFLDKDFDEFQKLAYLVLKENDPSFELAPDERFAAAIYGKKFKYSSQIRDGIAEGLAIIASNTDLYTNTSQQKAEFTSLEVVRNLLKNATWMTWGSLNGILPALAEAAPREFLDRIESALRQMPNPFTELYAQESCGLTGRNYMTGLLWALECLAWDEQWLVRVCVVLAELATFDPGGNWINRPINSIVTILLPWLPQTMGDVAKREVAVKTIIREYPDIAWKVLLQLLPDKFSSSSGTYKPKWRQNISSDFGKGISQQEYWQQVSTYASLIIEEAGKKTERLVQLIDNLDKLPATAFDNFLSFVSSSAILQLPEQERAMIWRHLTNFTKHHKRYSEADWSLSADTINRIETIALPLAPTDLFEKYQVIFSDNDFDLYDKNGNWEDQQIKLDGNRIAALREIYLEHNIAGVLKFAQIVSSQRQLGYALGAIGDENIDQALLPSLLNSEDGKLKQLVIYFIGHRHRIIGWQWGDNLDRSSWAAQQTAFFLSCLPFNHDTWLRATKWLKDEECLYWSKASADYHDAKSDINYAVKKLLEYDRPVAVLNCLSMMLMFDETNLPIDLCIQALLKVPISKELQGLNAYNIRELINVLQNTQSVTDDILCEIEWVYLAFLDEYENGQPKFLMRKLANEPEFFCEIIQKTFRSTNDETLNKEPTESEKKVAQMSWQLLQVWKIPPGLQADDSLDEAHLKCWLIRVTEISTKTGHLDIALSKFGKVLRYAPKDPSGLWIHRAVAELLNEKNNDLIRSGFSNALYNARGIHTVDPSGRQELDLATNYEVKAEQVENNGFHRLADTLRKLASQYKDEAKQIILRFADKN